MEMEGAGGAVSEGRLGGGDGGCGGRYRRSWRRAVQIVAEETE